MNGYVLVHVSTGMLLYHKVVTPSLGLIDPSSPSPGSALSPSSSLPSPSSTAFTESTATAASYQSVGASVLPAASSDDDFRCAMKLANLVSAMYLNIRDAVSVSSSPSVTRSPPLLSSIEAGPSVLHFQYCHETGVAGVLSVDRSTNAAFAAEVIAQLVAFLSTSMRGKVNPDTVDASLLKVKRLFKPGPDNPPMATWVSTMTSTLISQLHARVQTDVSGAILWIYAIYSPELFRYAGTHKPNKNISVSSALNEEANSDFMKKRLLGPFKRLYPFHATPPSFSASSQSTSSSYVVDENAIEDLVFSTALIFGSNAKVFAESSFSTTPSSSRPPFVTPGPDGGRLQDFVDLELPCKDAAHCFFARRGDLLIGIATGPPRSGGLGPTTSTAELPMQPTSSVPASASKSSASASTSASASALTSSSISVSSASASTSTSTSVPPSPLPPPPPLSRPSPTQVQPLYRSVRSNAALLQLLGQWYAFVYALHR